MTINATAFTSRFFAAAFAILLSTTMVIGSVGPAFNGDATPAAQSYTA